MSQPLPTEGLQMTISYLYLLSFCPPEHISHLKQSSELLRTGLSNKAELSEEDYFAKVIPEACRRIVAFHQNTREPDEDLVAELSKLAKVADSSPEAAWEFSTQMTKIAQLPERAKQKNRLRSNQGCQFCATPCLYGYFAMVSKPNYDHLNELLETELKKPKEEQDPLHVIWTFAMGHLWRTVGLRQGYVSANHLGNLGYCLLTLGMAKSRYPFPAEKMEAFQQANQALIENWGKDNK